MRVHCFIRNVVWIGTKGGQGLMKFLQMVGSDMNDRADIVIGAANIYANSRSCEYDGVEWNGS